MCKCYYIVFTYIMVTIFTYKIYVNVAKFSRNSACLIEYYLTILFATIYIYILYVGNGVNFFE